MSASSSKSPLPQWYSQQTSASSGFSHWQNQRSIIYLKETETATASKWCHLLFHHRPLVRQLNLRRQWPNDHFHHYKIEELRIGFISHQGDQPTGSSWLLRHITLTAYGEHIHTLFFLFLFCYFHLPLSSNTLVQIDQRVHLPLRKATDL